MVSAGQERMDRKKCWRKILRETRWSKRRNIREIWERKGCQRRSLQRFWGRIKLKKRTNQMKYSLHLRKRKLLQKLMKKLQQQKTHLLNSGWKRKFRETQGRKWWQKKDENEKSAGKGASKKPRKQKEESGETRKAKSCKRNLREQKSSGGSLR